ncbi:MAG: GNAT family N-acetyltransferase [Ignavibacteria bacterium]|nr:GNAT family N-acetyltransferase [Ignavibacteria bacterium]
MEIIFIKDKNIIEEHFRKNTELNIYSIGDLDDFFWERSKFYGIGSYESIEEIVLLYKGFDTPTFIALTDKRSDSMEELIKKIKPQLPVKFYTHLTPGLIRAFNEKGILENFGLHYKMSLIDRSLLMNEENENIRRLSSEDILQIKELFRRSYPDNFFDERMLDTGKYFGYFDKQQLIAIAGIHVYSERYRVAALGNITTDIAYRGRSIAQKLTSALCKDLLITVDNIGLNVFTENQAAINCYKKIGFEITGEYEEYLLG